jgi:cytochrome c-type biogenesis protein CcmH
MIAFWLVAALLTAGALLFVLPPLLGREAASAARVSREAANLSVLRDQLRELECDLARGHIGRAQFEAARDELEARVLEDADGAALPLAAAAPARRAALALGLTIPLLAAALYLTVGNPKALVPEQAAASNSAHALTPPQIQAMTGRLAARLEENPQDVEGWVMLARSYNVLGRHAEAAAAYARASALLPADAQLLADHADTLAMAQGRRLRGEPERLIARALEADPNNLKALALAGTAAFERGDYGAAVARWQRILALVPPESDIARSIGDSIADAQARAARR